VVYDRLGSALATARSADFNWRGILAGAAWFHWSGITPALSDAVAQSVSDAAAVARENGVKVSFDLNYRAKLWTRERAREVLTPMMKQVDVCVCSAEDARGVFGIRGESEREIASALRAAFGFEMVALTMRESSSANQTVWAAALFTGEHSFFSRRYEIDIVDRIGAGDAFTGGLISSLLRGDPPAAALEFAVAAGALKHTVRGDYPLFGCGEVEALLSGSHGGRVQR
jgi:2-dehydro-3-deoxygluconokinase